MPRSLPLALLAGLAAAGLAAAGLRAGDWPEFRGPTGQGLAEGPLPVAWGAETNLGWKVDVPGRGWSSPVVRAGRVYLTTAVSVEGSKTDDRSLRVLALDARTGRTLLDREVFRQDGSPAPCSQV